MLETALFSRLSGALKTWGTYSRVENAAESGTWDIFYCISGQAGWLETKVEKSGYLYFEKFQPNWGRRFAKEGLLNLFIIAALGPDDMAVYHVNELLRADREPYRKWVRVKVEDLTPLLEMKRPYVWRELRLLLASPFTLE